MFAQRSLLMGVVACAFFISYSDASPSGQKPKVCSNWCKTPQGQFYCCDDDPFTPVHSGHCPPVLDTFCGGNKVLSDSPGYEPPKECRHDGNCRRENKCCPEKCLPTSTGKVCKPAL